MSEISDPQELRFQERIIERLELAPDGQVADLGCGKGASLPMLIEALPQGTVHGLDTDAAALKAVTDRFQWAIDSEKLSLYQHDLNNPFPLLSTSLDAAVCHKVIEPFAAPGPFLDEVYRVLRPGGRFIVSHWDFDGLLFTHLDQALNRRIVRHYADHPPWIHFPEALQKPTESSDSSAENIATLFEITAATTSKSLLARDLPGILRHSPFKESGIHTHITNLTSSSYQPGMLGHRYAQHIAAFAARSKGLGSAAARLWLEGLETLDAQGRFLFSIPVILIAAQRTE